MVDLLIDSMKCYYTRFYLLILFFAVLNSLPIEVWSQCNALRPQVTIDFNTDQDCAPVTVTKYEITYYFNTAQNPSSISIRYEWNDPANSVTVINQGSGLVASAGNTAFTANSTFTYNNNSSCTITPTTTIYINGVACPTSRQVQTAFFWGREDQGNGIMSINPQNYDVCFNNPVTNAVFRDNSTFNCNIASEPDNPNRLARHVQFVYGTNHNAAATIRDLSLIDGGPQPLTNGSGALVSSSTRGTGTTVTAAYFGPVQTVPFPADGPSAGSFPMNAPANVLNLVGNRFEVTLYNWNVCNPWNGDALNPNYGDAVLTRAYIRIVDAPTPAFETRDGAGVPTTDFCINETIHFANQTANVANYTYSWTFFDDAAGTVTMGTSTSRNPTFSYTTGGQKLIRLRASNASAQGSCVEEITHLVNITPSVIAKIQITDLSNVVITPDFCQKSAAPLTTFNVRFRDASTGTTTAQTRWRWEFYNEANVLVRQEPTGGGYATSSIGPFDLAYMNRGIYRIKLIIIDNVTLCETSDEVRVRVFENPRPVFTAPRVCEGSVTSFNEASTLNPINGESIVLREWDFNYNGTVFNKDAAFDNKITFTRSLGAAGTYLVALRVTTNQTGCSEIVVLPVQVDPLPLATFSQDVTSGCSALTVTFTNNSVSPQPDVIDRFVWEVNEGSGFNVLATQRPTDPGFTNQFVHDFVNPNAVNKVFNVRLRVVTVNNCERLSAPVAITVTPKAMAGFVSANYSPFNDNCSPVFVKFDVDAATQALSPTDYTWRISDLSGVLSQESTGTTPSYTKQFINNSSLIKDFKITLIASLASGCSGDSTRTIRVSPIPVSSFTIDTLLYNCERMRLRFAATQKGLQYHWVISQNTVIMSNTTTNDDAIDYEVVRTGGDINLGVSLDTRNLANCLSAITTKSVIVPHKEVINASFTASPITQAFPNTTVMITNTTNAGAWAYLWDFGDGITSTESGTTLQHSYTTYGNYIITLKVSAGASCTETATQSVIILATPPVVDFDYAPRSGCAPLTVKFTNLSVGADPDKYVWEFGDGQATSKAVNPSYTYYEPGLYTVSLTAGNATGQNVRVTKQQIIEVYPRPDAQFDVKPKEVVVPDGMMFTSNRSFQATSYLWDFGDGTTSAEVQPQHSYAEVGDYTITLIAFNDRGCSDTTKMDGAVRAIKGGRVLIPNAFSPNISGSGGTTPGSGKNDVFMPLMRGVTEFEMLVFNRWGVLLFETRDQNRGWDGYYNGKLCAQDVYVYKLTASFSDGQKVTRTGDINLIR